VIRFNHTGVCKCWTPEEFARARKLRAAGYSATEIGTQLDRTRNAVLGRFHRHQRDTNSLARDLAPILGSRAAPAVAAHAIGRL
jgi:hypothetical protein